MTPYPTDRRLHRLVAAASAGAVIAFTGSLARAQAKDDLFQEAMARRAAGDCAGAVPLFEASRKLSPGIGKDFYLADCHEAAGRLRTAWSMFVDVAGAAQVLGKKSLEKEARARAATLEPRVPKLVVIVPAPLRAIAELAITLDGQPLPEATWGRPIPVDPGDHLLVASGSVERRVEIHAPVTRGVIEVAVPMLEDPPKPAEPPRIEPAPPMRAAPPAVTPPPAQPRHALPARRIAALAFAGGALAAAGLGTAFGVLAMRKDAEWKTLTSASCDAAGDCHSRAAVTTIEGVEGARAKLAGASTVGFVTAGACVASAAVLWLSARSPEPGPRVVIVPGAPGAAAGATLAGSF